MKDIMIRRILFISVILVLVLFTLNNTEKDLKVDSKIKVGKDMSFFVATDIHYLAKSLTDGGEAFKKYVSSGDGKQLDYMDEMMSTFSYEIKNKKPEVLIISGDLTNNGEKESHLELAKRLKEIETYGTSVYVIPGNHDILNPWARRFEGDDQYSTDNIDSEEFSNIYADFGYSEAVLKDKDTLSYLAAPSEELWLLMLDASKYKLNLKNKSPQGDGEISGDTLKWIKKCSSLAKSKGAKIITVMHHNLIDHNAVINKGFTINNSKEAIKVFKNNGLNLVFSGHIHIQDISSYREDENTIYDIATSSLSVYPNQYGVLKFTTESSAIDYNTSQLDVESWAKATGVKEKSLYDFKSKAEEFFGKVAYGKVYRQLLMEELYTDEQVGSMAETFRILNLRTFAGTENLDLNNIINSEGYKLWLSSPESFYRSYVLSIVNNKDTDDNNLHILQTRSVGKR